ncbi:hypothetical protein [Streptomyces violaceusniger]|uniref:hypothetical protein n=1 Tax=Streptomyces violaceusniger TaxID=68280 RepID=UPI00368851FF
MADRGDGFRQVGRKLENVPERGQSGMGPQDLSGLDRPRDRVDPVPCLARDHGVELPTGRFPGFERRDFDAFLAELVLDRITRLEHQSAALRDSAGTGAVADHLADALTTLFESVAVAIISLVTSRDELRTRLRETTPTGVPLLTEATAMIASYLAAERDRGRIAADADIDTLAPTLIGAGHLLFADREAAPPDAGAVRKVVTTVIAEAVRDARP